MLTLKVVESDSTKVNVLELLYVNEVTLVSVKPVTNPETEKVPPELLENVITPVVES